MCHSKNQTLNFFPSTVWFLGCPAQFIVEILFKTLDNTIIVGNIRERLELNLPVLTLIVDIIHKNTDIIQKEKMWYILL